MSLSGSLQQEMQSVYEHLLQMAEELESPLRDLVRSQVDAAQPYRRAAIVLAAGFDAPDYPKLQEARAFLATALEMLYIALSIHKLLMPYDGAALQADPNKTVLGSTVLAGDYCFSQSAVMAARTENPEVVAIFAKALQDVSESQLRQIFDLNDAPSQTSGVLFRAGVSAATRLRQASADETDQLVQLSILFASELEQPTAGNSLEHAIAQTTLLAPNKARWVQVARLYST